MKKEEVQPLVGKIAVVKTKDKEYIGPANRIVGNSGLEVLVIAQKQGPSWQLEPVVISIASIESIKRIGT